MSQNTLVIQLHNLKIIFIFESMETPAPKPQEKRELLWNFLELGDPYDINRSLIARLPGDKKPFMGDNIELVCLFQAAEIERLIEYLDEYKLKYRELERQELDRHSFEVQIKELSEMCADSDSLRTEVSKLREYIRRLKDELDNTRNREYEDHGLKVKYDNSLQKLESQQTQINDLKRQSLESKGGIEGWKSRYEALEKSKTREMEELVNNLETHRRTQVDREQKEMEFIHKFQIQRGQMETEIRRLREENSAKTMQLEELKFRLNEYNREVNQGHSELEGRYYQLEAHNQQYIEEIERLNRTMNDIVMERNDLLGRLNSVDAEISRRDTEIREFKRIVTIHEQNTTQLNRTVMDMQGSAGDSAEIQRMKQDYENRLLTMNQEITRLTGLSSSKMNESSELVSRYNRLEYQMQTLKNENSNLLSRLSDMDVGSKNVGELQNNLMRLTNENRRLSDETMTIRQSMGSVDKLRAENADLRRKLQDLENEALNTVDEIRKSSGLEVERFAKREEENIRRINELETAFRNLQSNRPELRDSALKDQMKMMTQSTSHMKRTYEQQIVSLNRENENLKRELDNQRRRVSPQKGDQDEVARLREEIEMWETQQREWTVEREEMLRITSDQQKRNRKPAEWEVKSEQYEVRIKELTEEVVALRRQTPSDSQFYEATINQLNDEIKRLQDRLKVKNDEIVTLESKRQISQNEIISDTDQNLDQPILILQREVEEYTYRFEQSETQVLFLQKEIERLTSTEEFQAIQNQLALLLEENRALKQRGQGEAPSQSPSSYMIEELQISLNNLHVENEELKTQVFTFQERISRMTVDMRTHQANINSLKNENDNLRLRIIEMENDAPPDMEARTRVISLEAQRDRLNSLLDQRTIEVTGDDRQLKSTIRQLEEEVRRLRENQNPTREVKGPRELEDARRQITILTRQLQTRSQVTVVQPQQGDQSRTMSAEIDKLNTRIRTKNEEFTNLDIRFKEVLSEREEFVRMNQEYTMKIESLTVEIRRLEGLGDQDHLQLTEIDRLNEVLRGKVNEVTLLQNRVRDLEQNNQGVVAVGQQGQEDFQRLKLRYQEVVSKVTTYEQRIAVSSKDVESLTRENANLNSFIQRLTNQINEYKQAMNRQVSESDRVQFGRQENDRLVTTINDLNTRLRQKMEETEMLKRKINESTQYVEIELRNHTTLYQQQVRNAEQKYIVEQQRFTAAVQEVEQLRRRVSEVTSLERRVFEYEGKINHLSVENRRMGDYEQRVSALQFENEQLRRQEIEKYQKYIAELNEYRQKHPLMKGENQMLQRQIEELANKIEIELSSRVNLENQLRATVEEFEKSKRRTNENDHRRLQEYESQLNILRQELQKLNGDKPELQRLKRSEVELVNKLNENSRKLVEYENRFSRLSLDTERLARLLKEKEVGEVNNSNNFLGEIERLNNALRVKVQESQEWYSKCIQVENEVTMLRHQYESVTTVVGQTTQETEAYRRRIQEHEQKFVRLNGEFEKLSQIINELKNQNTQLKQELQSVHQKGMEDKNKVLSGEIERLSALVEQLEQEVSEVRVRFVDQNALERRIKEHLTLLVVLFAEIESLRKRVKDKEKEVEQVRRSSLAPFMS